MASQRLVCPGSTTYWRTQAQPLVSDGDFSWSSILDPWGMKPAGHAAAKQWLLAVALYAVIVKFVDPPSISPSRKPEETSTTCSIRGQLPDPDLSDGLSASMVVIMQNNRNTIVARAPQRRDTRTATAPRSHSQMARRYDSANTTTRFMSAIYAKILFYATRNISEHSFQRTP